jgi:hypothetical protein
MYTTQAVVSLVLATFAHASAVERRAVPGGVLAGAPGEWEEELSKWKGDCKPSLVIQIDDARRRKGDNSSISSRGGADAMDNSEWHPSRCFRS